MKSYCYEKVLIIEFIIIMTAQQLIFSQFILFDGILRLPSLSMNI